MNFSYRLYFVLVFFLMIIGLGQSLSYFGGLDQTRQFFQRTGASPLPLVFSLHQGHEYWSPRHEIRLITRSQRKLDFTLGPAHFAALKGPYKLKLITISSILFAHQLSDKRLKWDLQQNLCKKNGYLNQMGEIGEDLVQIEITTRSRSLPFSNHRVVTCDD